MTKRGTTLIESLISILIVSVVIVTFLEALNVGMIGTLDLSRKTSALNIAQAQLEYVKSQSYNASTGDIADVYGLVTDPGAGNISDTINYTVSGTVTNASDGDPSLQKITIEVEYMHNKSVEIVGYKAPRSGDDVTATPQGKLVTTVVDEFPFLPAGGWWLWANWYGFYQVVETSTAEIISITWIFEWYADPAASWSYGAPHVGIFSGVPSWASRNYLGEVKEKGIIFRPGTLICGGCFPGCTCTPSQSGEAAPILEDPDCHCLTDILNPLWWYDGSPGLDHPGGTYEVTLNSGTLAPGTYTIVFFNGEDRIDLKTISASITYRY